eukprot:5263581-Pleurochrysis_carterae.AAC.1
MSGQDSFVTSPLVLCKREFRFRASTVWVKCRPRETRVCPSALLPQLRILKRSESRIDVWENGLNQETNLQSHHALERLLQHHVVSRWCAPDLIWRNR